MTPIPRSFANDERDGGIRDHVAVEGLRVHHVDIGLEVKLLRDELTERAAIAVLHPAVRADEGQPAAWRKALQGPLDKRNVEIGAVPSVCTE